MGKREVEREKPSSRHRFCEVDVLLLLLVACDAARVGAADTSAPDPSGEVEGSTDPGTLTLAFRIDADLVPEMAEPPTGAVLGAVYAEPDCTAVGPVDGAVPVYEFVTAPLDLHDGNASTVVVTTPPLDPGTVWLLACLDGDANGCDCGDPVTVPSANKARVLGDVDAPIVVTMDLLHPC